MIKEIKRETTVRVHLNANNYGPKKFIQNDTIAIKATKVPILPFELFRSGVVANEIFRPWGNPSLLLHGYQRLNKKIVSNIGVYIIGHANNNEQ